MTKDNWEKFFDGHAPVYMDNVFTQNTTAEIGFLLQELPLSEGARILDIGCGTGRHSVELARRGFRVTGVDISTGMLQEARKAAEQAGVQLTLLHQDASTFRTSEPFDACICLCEGAFALLGSGDDPIERDNRLLQAISDALKPGGRFLMTTLLAFRYIRQMGKDNPEGGAYDPLTSVATSTLPVEDAAGVHDVTLRERSYTPTELTLMLRLAGLRVENIWGGTAGNWGQRPIEPDEFEVMVSAVKPEG